MLEETLYCGELEAYETFSGALVISDVQEDAWVCRIAPNDRKHIPSIITLLQAVQATAPIGESDK